MELLGVTRKLEWTDSDYEDFSCGEGGHSGTTSEFLSDNEESDWTDSFSSASVTTISFTGCMDSSSVDELDLRINLFDLNAACWKRWEQLLVEQKPSVDSSRSESLSSAMSNNTETTDNSGDPGMNIFDLNGACWKRFEKFAAEGRKHNSASPLDRVQDQASTPTSLARSSQERRHAKICAAYWTSKAGVSTCRKGDSCGFYHVRQREEQSHRSARRMRMAKARQGRFDARDDGVGGGKPRHRYGSSSTASTSSTQASFPDSARDGQ
eukprot:TRINITY_DN45452_c0_g1_i1.p1 TRINITY_DN45452_c0_g1~~TRINITY_DN45452_c0_g1_i1.p1  ORF type:complete len:267 (+),score=41.41 TRINITY_DN45452_c0_g1_i1:125-925(+)